MTNTPIGPIAPVARRALACLVDLVIAGVIIVIGCGITLGATVGAAPRSVAAVLSAILVGLGITFAVAFAWFVVSTILQGAGASVGMRIMTLRVVRADTEGPLGFGRALLRNVVFGLSASIVVGCFTPLFDGSGRYQGWHDRASGALVRDARPAAAVPGHQDDPAHANAAPALADAVPVPVPVPVASATTALPHVPEGSAAGPDPVDATVTSEAAQAARSAYEAETAVITEVPGISPSVPAPSPVPVSGPEAAVAPGRPAPAVAPGPAAPAAAAPATAGPVVQSADEQDDLEDTRISIPGHRLLFVWDDGARATVSGRTLFGRNPAAEPGATIVAVRDETLSLSKTHFEAAAEAAGGWIMDRRSTNGITIVRDGVRIACPPGERVRIRLGDAIEIGERIVTVGGYA